MKRNQKFEPNGDAKLMHQVKEELRYCRYAYRTGQIYCALEYALSKISQVA